jgi:hypothetical protein
MPLEHCPLVSKNETENAVTGCARLAQPVAGCSVQNMGLEEILSGAWKLKHPPNAPPCAKQTDSSITEP